MREHDQTRRGIAIGAVLGFYGWLVVSALFVCPFLQAELSSANHPCCPRTETVPHCPLSKSLLDCPYYVTESKIGVTQAIQHQGIALLAASDPLPSYEFHWTQVGRPDRLLDTSGLLLRIHVLRI